MSRLPVRSLAGSFAVTQTLPEEAEACVTQYQNKQRYSGEAGYERETVGEREREKKNKYERRK